MLKTGTVLDDQIGPNLITCVLDLNVWLCHLREQAEVFFFFFFLPETEECSRRENQLFSQLGCCFRLWAVGPHVGIGDNLLGTRGSPPQADSQEMGTLVLQPRGTGFCYALSVPGGESVPELIRASTNSHLSLWFPTAEPMRNSDP